MIVIYKSLKNLTTVRVIKKVIVANYEERVDGTQTLSFTAPHDSLNPISVGMVALFNGQYYTVVRIAVSLTDMPKTVSVDMEHASFALTSEKIDEFIVHDGENPATILAHLLSETAWSVGIVEPLTTSAILVENETNKRAAIMELVAASGGNIEYDGFNINIRTHRGNVIRQTLTHSGIISLSAAFEDRTAEGETSKGSYSIALYRPQNLTVGDEVTIKSEALNLNVDTRVIGISYNPFDKRIVTVDVGSYLPEWSLPVDKALVEKMVSDAIGKTIFPYTAEFGTINGTGNLYFRTKYIETPVFFLRGTGELSWLYDAKGNYIGLSITGSDVTDVVCYCSLPEE